MLIPQTEGYLKILSSLRINYAIFLEFLIQLKVQMFKKRDSSNRLKMNDCFFWQQLRQIVSWFLT